LRGPVDGGSLRAMPSGRQRPSEFLFLRIRAGLSQERLARATGVSRQAISEIERRVAEPRVGLALAIARELGTTVEELFAPRP
jgi:putative transcriptional regulator